MNKINNLHVVIPHRGVYAGKTRLRGVLSDAARSELNRWLLTRTLRVVNAWLTDMRRCVVVSPCASTRALARHAGANAVAERALGLNAALAEGVNDAARRGAQRVLLLPCDLPLLDERALDAMAALSHAALDVVLAPDQHGSGTNALLITATAREFAFGIDSLSRHQTMAHACGLRTALCKEPALAFDLDTEADFWMWLHSGAVTPPFLAARRLESAA